MNHPHRRLPLSSFLLTLVLLTAPLQASTIALGYISFDTDTPASGQNSFTLYNFTGQTFGCSVDFQICDNVSIQSAALTISFQDSLGGTQTLTHTLAAPALPGATAPQNFIFDSAAFNILTAEITGTIAPLSFHLTNNSTFTADSSFDTIVDIQNTGIGIISLAPALISQAPEPAMLFPIAVLAIVSSIVYRRRAA